MITSSKQAKELAKKSLLSPKHGTHGKWKSTLIREQVLKEHAERNLSVLNELTQEKISIARIKLHKKYPNSKMAEVKLKAIESVEDRVLGKAVAQSLNVNVQMPAPIWNGEARTTVST